MSSGALAASIRTRTLLCAIKVAWCPGSLKKPVAPVGAWKPKKEPGRLGSSPAAPSLAFPPVYSACRLVFARN